MILVMGDENDDDAPSWCTDYEKMMRESLQPILHCRLQLEYDSMSLLTSWLNCSAAKSFRMWAVINFTNHLMFFCSQKLGKIGSVHSNSHYIFKYSPKLTQHHLLLHITPQLSVPHSPSGGVG